MGEIKTYTGLMFDPLSPSEEKIRIEDIAHALSMICRGNGHMKHFYSVCQHSINCMREARQRGYTERVQLACLLHDASEAYISDITRPVKAVLPEYLKIEAPLQNAIWKKWLKEPLSEEEIKQVFEIDDAMLWHEFIPLMDARLSEEEPFLKTEPCLDFLGFRETEQQFLACFYALTEGKRGPLTVGIDWMTPGWVAVEIQGTRICAKAYESIASICRDYQTADAILIDCPLGLPETAEEAALRPEKEARAYLAGKRKSSVFNVLWRQIVYADSVKNAWELNRQLKAGMTVTGQALRPMIRQTDEFLQDHPEWKNRIRESHPEVVFQKLNRNQGLQEPKHTEAGRRERLGILQKYGVDLQSVLSEFSGKQSEDVLDAACLALSAQLGCRYGFASYPQNTGTDATGITMQIVCGRVPELRK